MTDEEKGIETSRRISMACLSITSIQYCSMVKQAYLEGLAEGRKESNLIIQEGVKSNCRLQDKIEQLEKENEELKEKHESDKRALKLIVEKGVKLEKDKAELSNSVTELTNSKTELENKVIELNKQIEKMKCCDNCIYGYSRKDEEPCSDCDVSTNSKWGYEK